jgi:nucleotide-binding universal stress UspA family protein
VSENDKPRRIVVGVDGSENAARAAQWAAREAEERGGLEVHLVYGLDLPRQYGMLSPIPGEDMEARANAAGQEVLDKAREPLAAAHPELTITTAVSELGAAKTLVELSKNAAMVVTGSRGHGGFTGLLLGSVGSAVASHAHCPVVIVRE